MYDAIEDRDRSDSSALITSTEETPATHISYRKGKWTAEEENYANKIISLFKRGLLDIPSGTTLRSYLSEKLCW